MTIQTYKIHYWFHDNKKGTTFVMSGMSDEFDVTTFKDALDDGDDFDEEIRYGGMISYVKEFNRKLFLHCLSGPAYIDYNKVKCCFHVNGKNMKIEEMPINDEMKVVLTLKYGYAIMTGDIAWYEL